MVWYGMVWYGMVWYGMVWFVFEFWCSGLLLVPKTVVEFHYDVFLLFIGGCYIYTPCIQCILQRAMMSQGVPNCEQLSHNPGVISE